ncbi:MAG: glycosyltransferase family 4 protein, partial [Chthonomonadales bacterium]
MTDSPQRLKVGFIMSTEVGWKTQYLNWRNGLSPETGVDPVWIPINWWKEGGLIERTPGLPSGVKARLRSQLEIREGLDKGPFDALYVGVGHVLHGGKWFLQKQPYFITTDVTPLQLKDFGDLYGITGSRFPLYENRKHLGWVDRYKNAAGIFACSHWAAQSLINDYGLDPWRVYVLPPGIDTNKWQFPERELTDTLNILFVGGDFLRKGGDLLLKWAANTRFINWRMDIVTRDEVHNNDPRITVHHGLGPNDPALMELYRTANIFALPTRGDCYSLAGMEGLSSGLPVILSRTGGTGDIIRDGETGYLIGPGAGDELADRLDHLLANPEECVRMGRLGRQDAVERFDAITNINRTIEKIRAVLESSKQVPVPPLKATAIAAEPEKMIRVGFVMSTEVGWKTQYLNWREGLTPAMMVTPEWIVINWWDQKGVLEHIPLLPPGVKARIRSRMEL